MQNSALLVEETLRKLFREISFTHIFFLTPFLPPFESPLFLPTAMIVSYKRKRQEHKSAETRVRLLMSVKAVDDNRTGTIEIRKAAADGAKFN